MFLKKKNQNFGLYSKVWHTKANLGQMIRVLGKMITIYKIRDKNNGAFSNGSINHYASKECGSVQIQRWSAKKGKQWTNEKLIKDHLLKCIEYGGIPSNWEILEFIQRPSRELTEWVDAEMLVKILKINYNKK